MKAEITKEHNWLKQLIGTWRSEMDMPSQDGGEPTKHRGIEKFAPMGENWIIGDGEAEMPDGNKASMKITLGYDTAKQKFVGSWIGSMMNKLWVYEGSLDEVLTLESEGPVFDKPGETTQYKDIITLIDENHRTLTSKVLMANGEWMQMMEMHYYRE